MKTILVLTMLAASAALAEPTFTVYPQPGGAITGGRGQAIGWGFKLTGDSSNWVTITGSTLLFETNPGLGFYNDLIGIQGGPSSAALAPNATWEQAQYSAWFREGVGEFVINPLAMPGESNEGSLLVLYELFSADPNICGSACLNGSGSFLTPVSVHVIAAPEAVPEPGTGVLLAMAAVGGLLMRKAKRDRKDSAG